MTWHSLVLCHRSLYTGTALQAKPTTSCSDASQRTPSQRARVSQAHGDHVPKANARNRTPPSPSPGSGGGNLPAQATASPASSAAGSRPMKLHQSCIPVSRVFSRPWFHPRVVEVSPDRPRSLSSLCIRANERWEEIRSWSVRSVRGWGRGRKRGGKGRELLNCTHSQLVSDLKDNVRL